MINLKIEYVLCILLLNLLYSKQLKLILITMQSSISKKSFANVFILIMIN